MDPANKAQTARVIGRIPSGVFILTAAAKSRRTGMLASWVQQAGFEPLAVSVAVRKGRPIEHIIDESKHFVLNQLNKDPTAMFRHFGKGFGPDDDAFAGLKADPIPAGVALHDTAGVISCRVRAKHDAGDHWLYLGDVIDASENPGGAEPHVQPRNNGLH